MLNLDFLCTGMILNVRDSLLECDFSGCLGTLMSYDESTEPTTIINQAIRISEYV